MFFDNLKKNCEVQLSNSIKGQNYKNYKKQ